MSATHSHLKLDLVKETLALQLTDFGSKLLSPVLGSGGSHCLDGFAINFVSLRRFSVSAVSDINGMVTRVLA